MNCIDESMSKWVNEYTCPGFMFVPRKPWSFGDEYHDAGCAESDIIWSLELWEGKDWPTQLNNKPFDDLGKTVGTLLRLTEPVWGSGRVFVLDKQLDLLVFEIGWMVLEIPKGEIHQIWRIPWV